jgi:hypothetical protein
VSTIIITVDSKECDRLVACTVKAGRQSLGVTVARPVLCRRRGRCKPGRRGGGADTSTPSPDRCFSSGSFLGIEPICCPPHGG